MTTERTIKDGTWIRTPEPVSDSGDHNERHAPAGAIGQVHHVDGEGPEANFSVTFWPSFVSNFVTLKEIGTDLEILPDGHRDIPSAAEFDFASAVADIVAEGDIDEDERTVTAPADVVARILAGAREGRYAETPEVAELLGTGGAEVTLSYEDFDRLAAAAGVGDRLCGDEGPTP